MNRWPPPLAAAPHAKIFLQPGSIPQGFTNFFGFGGGRSFIGLGVTDASLFAAATENDTKSLYAAQMIAVDGQAATLKGFERASFSAAS